MKAWLARQSERDRRVLSIGATVVALALFWAFAWDPIAQSRRSLAEQAARAESDLIWMRGVAGEMRSLRARGQAGGLDRAGASLLALADRSAREANLGPVLKRVEPAGDGRVNVWLEGAGFDQIADWIEALARRYGVGVDEFAIDRAAVDGTVNARVTLLDAPTR
jgi:general secretion pathway protein M